VAAVARYMSGISSLVLNTYNPIAGILAKIINA